MMREGKIIVVKGPNADVKSMTGGGMMEDKDRVRDKGCGTLTNGERSEEVWQGMRDMGLW